MNNAPQRLFVTFFENSSMPQIYDSDEDQAKISALNLRDKSGTETYVVEYVRKSEEK